MFLWWNPYNVTMKVRSRQLWAQSSPYKNTWIQTWSNSNGSYFAYAWSRYAMYQTTAQTGYGQDFGDYFQSSVGSSSGDITFRPGEILFFSPAQARISDDYSKAFSNPWALGYRSSAVAGYKAHFYGTVQNDTVATVPSNIDEGKTHYVKLRLGIKGADTTSGTDMYPGNQNGYSTDGDWFAPRNPECITVMNGYNGTDGTNGSDSALGKRLHSPQRMLLGWYDPTSNSTNTTFCDEAYWTTDGTQSDDSQPFYIAALGVVAKNANLNVDSHIFAKKDFRTKIWQHSSPAFWGSSIVMPDDQMRQYHPYQLAALDVSAGLSSSPMDNIGNNGILGITGDGEQVSFASVLELPLHPPFALAGFAGMRLQPGWYTGGSANTVAHFRSMEYQSGVPGVGIGNSFADPCIEGDSVYTMHATKHNSSVPKYNKQVFGDFFDHALLINDALWDRWFCSSISDMPDKRGTKKAREVLENFLSGKEELPVARYKKTYSSVKDSDIVSRLMADDGWKYVAQYVMIDGGFNVNSISEEAWAGVLQGLANRQLVSNVDTKLSLVERGKGDDQVLFSRFMVSTTDKSVDALGGYSMLQGSGSFRKGSGMTTAWGEVRRLEPEQIRELAKEMVKQVKKRGPFLSMSDFINRRLEGSNDNSLKGALQAAIDETNINDDFQEIKTPKNGGDLFSFPKAEEGSIYTAAPGYLIQSDVLASLGNILTVRDDTFTVRAYGCVRNKRKAILAQAWCEATVQRTVEYVDPSNDPTDSEYEPDGTKGENSLSKVNKVLGRRFRVVAFKWLDVWDI